MVTTFINLYWTLQEATSTRFSPQTDFYEFRGIHLIPNTLYRQKTSNPQGIELEDWTAYLVNHCTKEEVELTDIEFFVTEVFEDENGIPQIGYRLNINQDFNFDMCYLRVEQLVGQTFYSNMFQISDLDRELVARLDYRDNSNENSQSIGIKMWFWQTIKSTELTSYYETSTKNTVAVQFKSQRYEKWVTGIISNELMLKISDVFEYRQVYLDLARVYPFEAFEIKEHEAQENFAENIIKLSFNEKDIFDPNEDVLENILLPQIILTNVVIGVSTAQYIFTFANFSPTFLIFEYSSDLISWTSQNDQTTSPVTVPFEETGTYYFRVRHPDAVSNVITLAINAALVANNDTAKVNKGGFIDINVLFNDVLAGVFSITNISTPTRGTAVLLPNNRIRYTHDDSVSTADSFTYTISNGSSNDTATVNVTVLNSSSGNSTMFMIGNGNSDPETSCGFLVTLTKYHDGASAQPTLGDFVFDDLAQSTAFAGGNNYYPIANGRAISIDNNGMITDLYICGAGNA